MHVPAILYADEALIREMDEKVREQAVNVATLPGIVRAAYAMPDAHWGYGFPIGGVAASRRVALCRQAASASTSPAACARI
jgi:tRNA-splicing ligase RtcB